MSHVKVNHPGTFYIKFTGTLPNYFSLIKSDTGEIFYFRFLDGKTPRIKFNLLHEGIYKSDVSFEVVKIGSLELPKNLPKLPAADRNRVQEPKIEFDSNMDGVTPIIYSKEGVIKYPSGFKTLPPPIQYFLLLHETGHFLYSDEFNCDLWAFVNYMKQGYNRSMALYALSVVLSVGDENIDRILAMYNNIQKTQKNPL